MRILFALPGFHRVMRGAETALEQVAKHIALMPGYEVTMIGSGQPKDNTPYKFQHVPCIPRERFERFPSLPYLRGHYVYEELTFAARLMGAYNPADYDVTVSCSYPYTNWVLRAKRGDHSPKHVFVTQNGDWMCHAKNWEFRHFDCDGLVCTNPEYYENHHDRYLSKLIPNGVDPNVFKPGSSDRRAYNLPEQGPLVLMVSALIPSKRVIEGIRAVARLPNVCLAIAGDGELRSEVQALGQELLGDRFRLLKLRPEQMPGLYQCADAVLHMSQDEPFGNVYIEALASGLPVVAHDWRVTRWILEDCGIFVDTSDLQSTADLVQIALTQNSRSAIQRRRELVERRFTWSRLAEQYCTLFNQVRKAQKLPATVGYPAQQQKA